MFHPHGDNERQLYVALVFRPVYGGHSFSDNKLHGPLYLVYSCRFILSYKHSFWHGLVLNGCRRADHEARAEEHLLYKHLL